MTRRWGYLRPALAQWHCRGDVLGDVLQLPIPPHHELARLICAGRHHPASSDASTEVTANPGNVRDALRCGTQECTSLQGLPPASIVRGTVGIPSRCGCCQAFLRSFPGNVPHPPTPAEACVDLGRTRPTPSMLPGGGETFSGGNAPGRQNDPNGTSTTQMSPAGSSCRAHTSSQANRLIQGIPKSSGAPL